VRVVPKVSELHKERRREEILAAAQRCFAKHGYEGATVARLEAESGLSRGAIFNYFENKEALFVEIAGRTSQRVTDVWFEQGLRAALEAIVEMDVDWLSVQLESTRRVLTDPKFRRHVEAKEAELSAGRGERLAKLQELGVREDVPIEQAAMFLSIVLNGLAVRRTVGDPLPDLDTLVELVDSGIGPRPVRSRRSRRPASARHRAAGPARGRPG
jgi:TetR/AcrR family transcriptional regulator, transcriptional repressor of aconitase